MLNKQASNVEDKLERRGSAKLIDSEELDKVTKVKNTQIELLSNMNA